MYWGLQRGPYKPENELRDAFEVEDHRRAYEAIPRKSIRSRTWESRWNSTATPP